MQSLVSGGLAATQAARLILSGGEPAPLPSRRRLPPWRRRPTTSPPHWTGWTSRLLPTPPSTGSSPPTPSRPSCRTSCCPTCTGSENAGRPARSRSPRALRLQPARGRLPRPRPRLGPGLSPGAILACLPGEHHELGLLAFGVTLRRRGWRITCLGTDSPIGAVADTAQSSHLQSSSSSASTHKGSWTTRARSSSSPTRSRS